MTRAARRAGVLTMVVASHETPTVAAVVNKAPDFPETPTEGRRDVIASARRS